MLSKKYKDIVLRTKLKNTELNSRILKVFFVHALNNKALSKDIKKRLVVLFLKKRTAVYSRSKLQRRCLITNRSKVSYQRFGISRIKLREFLRLNILPKHKQV